MVSTETVLGLKEVLISTSLDMKNHDYFLQFRRKIWRFVVKSMAASAKMITGGLIKRRFVRQMAIWYVVPLSIENKKNGSSRQKLTGIWPFWYTWIRQSLTYRSMDRLKVLSVCRRAYQNLFRADAHKLSRRLLIIHKILCCFHYIKTY